MGTDIFKVRGINVANIYSDSEIAFFGIAVLAGSNYETPEVAGVSHFSEHLFFKGSQKRNWKQINEEFPRLGADSNAYTSNTEVVYHSTFPKENLEKVINLLCDMFFNSTLPKNEIEKERSVIEEEKKMYEDDPRSSFICAANQKLFSWNVGHDVIGTSETIKSISREQIVKYLNEKTNLDNFIFICSGNVKSEDLAKFIENNIPEKHEYLKQGNGLHDLNIDQVWKKEILESNEKIKFLMEKENITQSNIYLLTDGLPYTDINTRYAEAILLNAIGGGMFSKLFSRIREELGLCYSVGMYPQMLGHRINKIETLYGFTSPENVDKFMIESENVLKDVLKNGIDKNIFECAKTDYLSKGLRGIETSSGKAIFLLRRLLLNINGDIESCLNKIRNVTIEDCNEVAKKVLNNQWHWVVMNPKKK